MKIKTVKYEDKCPKCGSTNIKATRHSDCFGGSYNENQCAECGQWYRVSETYDEDQMSPFSLKNSEAFKKFLEENKKK